MGLEPTMSFALKFGPTKVFLFGIGKMFFLWQMKRLDLTLDWSPLRLNLSISSTPKFTQVSLPGFSGWMPVAFPGGPRRSGALVNVIFGPAYETCAR